ncbi:XdhC family aldehyde oxidoreductase maturation factor [Desulfofustis glycolicus]|uniref:Xanthine dehydrogenase accessory factor n=1 Tax=Desulfofustis glycolicus DSM 9705 TaxID=1121409 RepID=A0A1M5YHU9_9BACT|nr:XdhC/CoxI family protein [Desulfofustis glycolicus]MCB2214816.1 XdhC family protein [Desulfobulbaceae bacterium]SHI11596.1 xanthine dehydrogenase accessory factor [Desulfofustis glycolicus DSM 9705]
MRDLLKQLVKQVQGGRELVLASIISHSGSTPRSSGSLMLVFPDDSIQGSVGGGLLEAKVQEMAKELFQSGGLRLVDFILTGDEAARDGMLCGGQVRIRLEHVPSEPESVEHFDRLADIIGRGRNAVLVSQVEGSAERLELAGRWVLDRQGGAGDTHPEPLVDLMQQQSFQDLETGIIKIEKGRFLVEPFMAETEVIIVGAGHVGQATARLTAMVGFRTVVLDDRADFASKERFPEADQVEVLESFQNCFTRVRPGRRSFLVIMTRGHLHDRGVLAQALSTEAGYIGMIGSARKRTAIYEALLDDGVSEAALARVHSPIGLSIKAETPAEIAVSIVAEMIQKRAELLDNAV